MHSKILAFEATEPGFLNLWLFRFFIPFVCFFRLSQVVSEDGTLDGTGAMFVGAQKKLPKKERGRKEKGEDYILSHLIKSSH